MIVSKTRRDVPLLSKTSLSLIDIPCYCQTCLRQQQKTTVYIATECRPSTISRSTPLRTARPAPTTAGARPVLQAQIDNCDHSTSAAPIAQQQLLPHDVCQDVLFAIVRKSSQSNAVRPHHDKLPHLLPKRRRFASPPRPSGGASKFDGKVDRSPPPSRPLSPRRL